MTRYSLIALSMLLVVAGPVTAAAPTGPAAVEPVHGDKMRDRASILAMAGTYKVTFDMRETVSFVPGYELLKPHLADGHEVVRVVEDTPDRIALQHLLVVPMKDAKPIVVKHWRQAWAWQPTEVLTYAAPDRWSLTPVLPAAARGAWSQTVYQTDDSPRYGGIGRWRYDDGVARWTSAETSRPLARRDATRKPPYDHYIGTNRHALTPTGWVHEQDNAKIGQKGGKTATFAHEVLLNSYIRATDFPIAAADDYWAKTRDYWAFIRSEWARRIAAGSGLTLPEEAGNGSVTGHELMLIADDIANGEIKLPQATREAKEIIDKAAR